MDRFIDRQQELLALNKLLGQDRAQFAFVYGRPRVGKTALLQHWAQQSGLLCFYWTPPHGAPEDTEASLIRALQDWAHIEGNLLPLPGSHFWDPFSISMLRAVRSRPAIFILDEFHRAAEAAPALPSLLQNLWDHELEKTPVALILVGSHFGTSLQLQNYEAPLYGRCTAIHWIDPLPYAALADFLPGYTTLERIATYAAVGGIPAYLEQFDPGQSLDANIGRLFFPPAEVLRDDLTTLLQGLPQDSSDYGRILRAIAHGCVALPQIVKATGIAKSVLLDYLYWLQKWRLVEPRFSAMTPPKQESQMARLGRGRYYVRDPYLRFYLRFVEPNAERVARGQAEALWKHVSQQFWASVGPTAFEELCREWVWEQGRTGKLPFPPEQVSSYWSKGVQVDLMAINWRQRAILLGACRWDTRAAGPSVLRGLMDKAPRIVPDKGWQVHYVVFARAGFTAAAGIEAEPVKACLVDLEMLEADLRCTLTRSPLEDSEEEVAIEF